MSFRSLYHGPTTQFLANPPLWWKLGTALVILTLLVIVWLLPMPVMTQQITGGSFHSGNSMMGIPAGHVTQEELVWTETSYGVFGVFIGPHEDPYTEDKPFRINRGYHGPVLANLRFALTCLLSVLVVSAGYLLSTRFYRKAFGDRREMEYLRKRQEISYPNASSANQPKPDRH